MPHRLRLFALVLTLLASACSTPAATDRSANGAASADDEAATSDAGRSTVRSDGASSPEPESKSATEDLGNGAGIDRDGNEPSTSTGETFPVADAAWAGCGGGFECATLSMPLDHDQPRAGAIDVSLIRVPGPADARGSIFVNLGGPGGSAIAALRNGFRLDEETMDNYHLVGFDPRGIGASTPLTCDIDLTTGPRPDFSPDSEAELTRLDDQARALAEECGTADGPLLPHLGTDSVIRDLDLLRQAVGDDRLNYIGLSYGTVIGLRYTNRYPTLVGRLVLDGVVDPSFSLPDLLRQQAIEFERAFLVIDEACGVEIDCPRGGVTSGFDRVSRTLEEGGPRGGVDVTELEVATLVAMYSERLWFQYADALLAAEAGDFSGIERLHDLYVGGISFAAYLAVSCIDSTSPVGADAWNDLVAELDSIAPRFGATLANEVRSCAYWPAAAVGRPVPVAAPNAGPILVLSTTGDAATPLVNAATVAAELPSSGLVIVQGEGHTAYGTNFCVDRIVADYFDTGRVPDSIHRC